MDNPLCRHFIYRCKCGSIIRQCKCEGVTKEDISVDYTCGKCVKEKR